MLTLRPQGQRYVDHYPVGCGALRPLDEYTVEVKRMYTRFAYRRRGVAQVIMVEFERLALEFGYTTIKLQTGPLQPEAAALLRAAGRGLGFGARGGSYADGRALSSG